MVGKAGHVERRQFRRFKEHCTVEFVSEGKLSTGTSGNIDLNGLFIMTGDAKAPGTILDIVVHLPDGATSKLRGRVRRFFKTVAGKVTGRTDGMGVEIIEKDAAYLHFIRSLLAQSEDHQPLEAPEKEQGKNRAPLDSDKKKRRMTFDEMLFEHISARLKGLK